MNIQNAIESRRSVRKFETCTIPEEDFKTILKAGMMAPSACNSRPWEFVVIKDPEMVEKIAVIHPFARQIRQAGHAILISGLPSTQSSIATGFWPQDCGAVAQNIILSAQELGYASCWCGVYPNERLIAPFVDLFELGEGVVPTALIILGKAAEEPSAKGFYEDTKVKWC